MLNVLIRTEIPRGLVSSRPFLPNSDFTPASLRIVIGGGSNVTLEGSQDQHGGWVNSHGQQVGEKPSAVDDHVLKKVY